LRNQMLTFITKTLKSIVDLLPATLARLLLLLMVVGAVTLHAWATARIDALERTDLVLAVQNRHVLAALQGLRDEVRGYRTDMREENQQLRQERRNNRQQDRADRVTDRAADRAAATPAAAVQP
jgi:hypothetical protein